LTADRCRGEMVLVLSGLSKREAKQAGMRGDGR